jgi:hypothetical protein
MNIISYFNPLSSNHHATHDFLNNLTYKGKAVVILTTCAVFLISCTVATLAQIYIGVVAATFLSIATFRRSTEYMNVKKEEPKVLEPIQPKPDLNQIPANANPIPVKPRVYSAADLEAQRIIASCWNKEPSASKIVLPSNLGEKLRFISLQGLMLSLVSKIKEGCSPKKCSLYFHSVFKKIAKDLSLKEQMDLINTLISKSQELMDCLMDMVVHETNTLDGLSETFISSKVLEELKGELFGESLESYLLNQVSYDNLDELQNLIKIINKSHVFKNKDSLLSTLLLDLNKWILQKFNPSKDCQEEIREGSFKSIMKYITFIEDFFGNVEKELDEPVLNHLKKRAACYRFIEFNAKKLDLDAFEQMIKEASSLIGEITAEEPYIATMCMTSGQVITRFGSVLDELPLVELTRIRVHYDKLFTMLGHGSLDIKNATQADIAISDFLNHHGGFLNQNMSVIKPLAIFMKNYPYLTLHQAQTIINLKNHGHISAGQVHSIADLKGQFPELSIPQLQLMV